LHPPFQIDGNFGATSGIAEMLLQSHSGELHLLPALHSAWPTGNVAGLRGRGGYTVGATWSGGRIDEFTLEADRDGTVKVRSRMFTGDYELVDESSGDSVQAEELESGLIEFAAQFGRTYRATSLGTGSVVEPGVHYRLVAQHSGKAADIEGASTAAGAALIQWSLHGGTNQQFDFLDSGDGHYRIRARHSGLVLQTARSASRCWR
ncbi:RICIN domain-containing protein, partial [Glycomyces tenuis]|uniref:RICIN domain-containing protein n=1 Tax=Glycomyces tenuis TaxID=58116 RepID=UPI003D157AAB